MQRVGRAKAQTIISKRQSMQQGQNNQSGEQNQNSGGGGGGSFGGIGDKLNSAARGGKESEKNEDYVGKGQYINQTPSTDYL